MPHCLFYEKLLRLWPELFFVIGIVYNEKLKFSNIKSSRPMSFLRLAGSANLAILGLLSLPLVVVVVDRLGCICIQERMILMWDALHDPSFR